MLNGLDRETYEKFVGNGWAEWDDKLHNSLCRQPPKTAFGKKRMPWER